MCDNSLFNILPDVDRTESLDNISTENKYSYMSAHIHVSHVSELDNHHVRVDPLLRRSMAWLDSLSCYRIHTSESAIFVLHIYMSYL